MKKIQLHIPQPCHEDWQKMTPEQKGRFCAACQKTVIDFSSMSDRQLAEYFRKPVGDVCGRFHNEQLNRDLLPPKKRLPWIRYFFQFTLPAVLITAKASAQGRVALRTDSVQMIKGKIKAPEETAVSGKRWISGVVQDSEGKGIPSASVMVVGTGTGTATDSEGRFSFPVNQCRYLQITCIGYKQKKVKCDDTSNLKIVLDVDMTGTLGVVIVTKTTKKPDSMPLLKNIKDTAFRFFSVYPNPTRNNSNMTLDLSRMEKGEYVVSIIDMQGDILQTEEISLGKKILLKLYLRDLIAGTYLVHLFNRKTAASFSEKIIVE